jgi:flagellum-specific peptidoglycan hydrolase FlgJ
VPSAGKPWWQQATALVSLGAGGAITGFSFVPRTPAELKSPSSLPVHLMALEQSAQPKAADRSDQRSADHDGTLRSAIVKVASYYLRVAQGKTPAEMEAIIWQHDSIDGLDHGESCAAFASMTLELGAQVVGGHSWVTGGGSYPWPLHKWADVRVQPNPASPGVTSILQDAEAHHRWHPLGDGYQPQPGDWVLFDGHIEVVTKYADGVLHTIGGDSVPNFSVNAHSYPAPLGAQGVAGFVNNGDLSGTADGILQNSAQAAGGYQAQAGAGQAVSAIPGLAAAVSTQRQPTQVPGVAAIPGMPTSAPRHTKLTPSVRGQRQPAPTRMSHLGQQPDQAGSHSAAGVPGAYMSGVAAWPQASMADTAVIPGLPIMAHRIAGDVTTPSAARYSRHQPSSVPVPARGTQAQQAFISQVAPGAIAAQREYGVPASVTIAQAIDESGWGQSGLALRDHNLFGIKGVGPAGSDPMPTSEYVNGQQVSLTASFRVYRSVAQSIDDHGRLLATSGYYTKSMAVRHSPDAFASSLTGVYATDPTYGQQLINLMQQYDLYRYDVASPAGAPAMASDAGAAVAGTAAAGTQASGTAIPGTAAPGSPAGGTTAVGTAIPGTTAAGLAPADRPPSSRPAHGTRSAGTPGARSTAPGNAPPSSSAPGTQLPTPRAPDPQSPATTPDPRSPTTATSNPESPTTATRDPLSPSPASPGPAPSTSAAAQTGSRLATISPGTAAVRTPAPEPAGSAAAPAAPAAPAGPTAASAAAGAAATSGRAVSGMAAIPGLPDDAPAEPASPRPAVPAPRRAPEQGGRPGADAAGSGAAPSAQAESAHRLRVSAGGPRRQASGRAAAVRTVSYQLIPPSVRNDFVSTARAQLVQTEPLYIDVADHHGISWQLLAACDWMQCKARPRYSPVQGEKLGQVNVDGTSYRTKSEALEQCADDLVQLARAVYRIDVTAGGLSVRELANVFAAFRWGVLLKLHRTSALEFPYSVAGLTDRHMKMRWPNIDEPGAPDKPGTRFRSPFGAVPIVLCLDYPATA